jgi:WD40 repeat protein
MRTVVKNPQCPVIGHSDLVSQVEFSPDGSRVISSSYTGNDNSVRVWDVASGRQVREHAGEKFAFVEGPSGEHMRDRHVLTALDDKLLIYEGAKEQQHAADGAEAPVACFKAPTPITSVRCHGAAICVGCDGGAVCMLSAPFLTV